MRRRRIEGKDERESEVELVGKAGAMSSSDPASAYQVPIGRFANDWSYYRSQAFTWVTYAVTIVFSALIAYGAGKGNEILEARTIRNISAYPLVLAWIGDLMGTIFIWISAIVVNNSSMYDPYWSVFPPVAMVYFYLAGDADEKAVPAVRVLLVLVSVWTWAIRLTRNWCIDWHGLKGEDFRYQKIADFFREKGYRKEVYWLVGSFGGIMLFPTVLVFLGCIPVYLALYTGLQDGARDLNFVDFLATFICVGSAIGQLVSDGQMRRWRKKKPRQEAIMEEGLWNYSRHPNYFFEQTFWFGLYVHALAVNGSYWWSGIGVLSMVLLFTFASVPLMETRMLKKRPHYKQVQQSTSMMIPMPKRGPKASDAQVSPK